MGISKLEEQAFTAVCEAIGRNTVAIDISRGSRENPDWCTGSLVIIKRRSFIITCGHAIKPEIKNEDLRFLFRSEKGFQWTTKEEIKKLSIRILNKIKYKTFPKPIPIINRIYSNEEDDLVLLEVDQSWAEVNSNWFYKMDDLDAVAPGADHPVYYMGFSRELIREANVYGDIGVFPFFGVGQIINKEIDSTAFNPELHFLIDFSTSGIDEYSIDAHGLSGCGVWSRTPSGEGNLWIPNIYLVGVQHGYFRKSEVLKATKIERVIRLI